MPVSERIPVIKCAHFTHTGHLKFSKMQQLLRACYFWHEIHSDIKKVIDSCGVCAKLAKATGYCPLQPITSSYPFELVSMNVGSVTLPGGQQDHFIVAIDHFTCWVEVKPIRTQTSAAVEKFVCEDIITQHGCPSKIQTDNAPNFVSSALNAFFEKFGIKYMTSAVCHPESNSMAEKMIRNFKEALSRLWCMAF